MNKFNDSMKKSIIDYYNKNKLSPFNMNQMLLNLKLPLELAFSTYNDLANQGLLITIDNDKGQSHMIEAFDHDISNLKDYLKEHRDFINKAAQKLNVHISVIVTAYCKASGIHNKEKYWEISDWFING